VEENQKLAARVVVLERFERVGLLEGKVDAIEKANVFQKIDPRIDTTTTYIGNLTLNGLEVFGNKNVSNYHPCFLTNRIEGKQYFEV